MNIIIHAHKLSKYGGLERIIAELSNAMSDRGHNIFLFSDESLDVPPVYTLNDDIRRIHFTYNGDSRRLPAAPKRKFWPASPMFFCLPPAARNTGCGARFCSKRASPGYIRNTAVRSL